MTETHFLTDGKNYRLVNKVDPSEAISEVKATNERNERSENIIPLGHIPSADWSLDPWLIAARKAMIARDYQEYTENIKKYFKMKPYLRVNQKRKYFNGVDYK